MQNLVITGLTKSFRTRRRSVTAIDDVDLEVNDGELVVLLGPSGCGKTTTLRVLAGLEAPDAGRIVFGEQVVFDGERRVDVRPNKRDIGMVFQSFALWPHMTVRRNIAYPLRARRRRHGLREGWVEAVAELVDCAELLDQYPSQLSGGQQQRVALARALVARPTVMLFDEPLSNLDAKLREQLRSELHQLHGQVGFTGVYVTHDQAEALALGDRLAIMRAGRIEQLGTPEQVFSRPRSEYVAEFIGVDNIIELTRAGSRWRSGAGPLHGAVPDWSGEVARVRVRKEDLRIHRSPEDLSGTEMGVSGAVVRDVSFAGRTRTVVLDLADERVVVDLDAAAPHPDVGDEVVVACDPQRALVYGESGELAEEGTSAGERDEAARASLLLES